MKNKSVIKVFGFLLLAGTMMVISGCTECTSCDNCNQGATPGEFCRDDFNTDADYQQQKDLYESYGCTCADV